MTKQFLSALLLMLFTAASNAVGVANVYDIEFIRVDQSGKGYVQFVSNLVGSPPACASGYPKAMAFDASTPGGKAILAAALAAQASGRKVYVNGSGACSTYNNLMEDWNWGYTKS